MAQIPNLQSTNTLGTDDQAILRQGTIDKRISLELATTLSWAKRNGYTHLGQHTVGLVFPDTDSFSTYQGKVYFVKGNTSLPYTSASSDPSLDTGLFLYEETKGYGANLLSNHNFLTPSTLVVDSTPQDVSAGVEIFSGIFSGASGIQGLTYIDGRVSFSGGDFYIPRANSKELENITEFVASVADFDGKPRTRGVSFALVGDEYRVTVGVDALEDESANETLLGSVKFEQGSVATGHEVIEPFNQTEQWKMDGDIRGWGAVGDGVTDDTAAIQAAFDVGGKIYIPKGDYRFTQLLIKQPTNYIYGDGHRESLLRPIPITHDASSATVPNRAGFIVKELETLPLRGLTFEDLGFIGYRDGTSVIDGIVDFVRIVTAVGTKDRNIKMIRCRMTDPLRDGLGCSVRSNGAGTYGTMDGVRMIDCEGDVTNFNNHLSPTSNMFRTMIEYITYDHTTTYGSYPISNCYSLNNYCYFWRTLTDFKRGTKNFTCSDNITQDMTDVDHSTDGSRYGIFSNNVGRISNDAVDTGRFIEIQGLDIKVNGVVYDANGLNGNGSIMVQDYPYPAEGTTGLVGHQSKGITISDVQIRNENNHAVRIINAADVVVSDVTGIDCALETVFFTHTVTEDLDNPGNDIEPKNGFASDIKSIRGRNAVGASTTFPVSVDKCIDEKGRQSFAWGTTFIDQSTHNLVGLSRYDVLNSNPELKMNEAETLVPSYTIPVSDLSVSVVDAPIGAGTAIEINDTSTTSVKTLICDDKFKYFGEENIYLRAIVRKVTAPTCGFVIRYYDAAGAQLSNSFELFIILSTEWKDLAIQVQIPEISNCAYFKVELAAASESNSPANTGSSQWANFRVSRDLPFGKF